MTRILLVDDERDVVTMLKFILERDGYEVATAYNGAEALAVLGVEPRKSDAPIPDLIILDVMMPVMDGFSASAKLAQDSRTKAIPLVILSAKGGTRDLFKMSPNVAAFLDKPFDPKKLRDLVAGMNRPEIPHRMTDSPRRILIVDDESEIVTLLRFILEKDGYDISSADNGQLALDRLIPGNGGSSAPLPDLIILDIMMPVMDGYTLNMRLQANAVTKTIPILVLTAKGQKMRDLFEMAPNVAAYVQKPFDPKMLRDLIAGIIAHKR